MTEEYNWAEKWRKMSLPEKAVVSILGLSAIGAGLYGLSYLAEVAEKYNPEKEKTQFEVSFGGKTLRINEGKIAGIINEDGK